MSTYGGIIITQEDLDKAKLDLAKEVKALRKKYSFLHNYEIKAIVLESFSLERKTKKVEAMFGKGDKTVALPDL